MQAPRYERNANTLFTQPHFRAFLFTAIAFSLAIAVLTTATKEVHRDEYDNVYAARFNATHSSRGAARSEASLMGLNQVSRAPK